jgi:CheY-like chemotaxis protein
MSMDEPRTEPPENPLAGRRVLVVEDSPVVAEAADDMLRDMGCVVVGPATTMAPALQMAGEEQLDAAIVDVNIRGGKAFPVLRILHGRAIPFLLTSGYADWTMPEEWQDQPRLPKPYTPNQLRESLVELLAGQLR